MQCRMRITSYRYRSHQVLLPPLCFAVAVQRLRDPVQEGRAARRGGRSAGAAGRCRCCRVVRVRRLREAAAAVPAAVGMLRPGRRGEVGVLRDVRRRRRRRRRGGRRALPVVDAQRDALLAGVRRPGEAHPVPVLLASTTLLTRVVI